MPFEDIEESLNKNNEVSIFRSFGGGGCRVSPHSKEGLRIWFTNSFGESDEFKESREKILSLWEEAKKS